MDGGYDVYYVSTERDGQTWFQAPVYSGDHPISRHGEFVIFQRCSNIYIYIYILYVRHIFVYNIICLSFSILIAPSFLLQIFRNRLRPAWISPWAKWTNWSLGATRPWKGEPPVSWNMATKNSPFRDGKSPMIYRWFMGFNGLYCNVNHVFCWVNGTSDVHGYHAPKQHRPGESLLFRGN